MRSVLPAERRSRAEAADAAAPLPLGADRFWWTRRRPRARLALAALLALAPPRARRRGARAAPALPPLASFLARARRRSSRAAPVEQLHTAIFAGAAALPRPRPRLPRRRAHHHRDRPRAAPGRHLPGDVAPRCSTCCALRRGQVRAPAGDDAARELGSPAAAARLATADRPSASDRAPARREGRPACNERGRPHERCPQLASIRSGCCCSCCAAAARLAPPPPAGARRPDLQRLPARRAAAPGGSTCRSTAASLALALLVVALARPQLGYAWEESQTEGIDIQLVLDVSGSMGAEDFQPKNRLEVAKKVLRDFVGRPSGRPHRRWSVFAGAALTKAPPTTDRAMLAVAGRRRRAAHAARRHRHRPRRSPTPRARLKDSQAKSKVIVLVTDGDNNAGQIDPASAAASAAGPRHQGLHRRRRHARAGPSRCRCATRSPARSRSARVLMERAASTRSCCGDRRAHRRPLLPRHRSGGAARHLRRHRPAREARRCRCATCATRSLPAAAWAALALLLLPLSPRRSPGGPPSHERPSPTRASPGSPCWRRSPRRCAAWVWRRRLRAVPHGRAAACGAACCPATGRPPGAVVAGLALAVPGTALALARPRWGEHTERSSAAASTSSSCSTPRCRWRRRTSRPTRLYGAKPLLRRLVAGLAGHRLALVQSRGRRRGAGAADARPRRGRPAARLARRRLAADVPGTRLAPASAAAMLLFPPERGKRRVVVLLSDGEDHGEDWSAPPRSSAKPGVVVHAVGVGTPQGCAAAARRRARRTPSSSTARAAWSPSRAGEERSRS